MCGSLVQGWSRLISTCSILLVIFVVVMWISLLLMMIPSSAETADADCQMSSLFSLVVSVGVCKNDEINIGRLSWKELLAIEK